MPKLSTLHASKTQRVLIYGPPKTGKTELAGMLAEHFNLLWFDLENGHDTLFKLPVEWQERIELISLRDTRDFPIGIETMLKVFKGTPVDICHEHGKVGCMLCKKVDALTTHVELNALDRDTIVVVDSDTQLTNSGIAHITRNQPDEYKLDWDDWGKLGVLMDKFHSYVQQANYNVVVISHDTEAETEDGKKVLVPVAGTRNFSRNVAKYFDHVVYAERKLNKHVFMSSTTASSRVMAGSRTDADLSASDNPTLLDIFKPGTTPTAIREVRSSGSAQTKSILDKVKKQTT